MKIRIFNRGKYIESINKLYKRKAPDYVIEAYNQGYTDVVNYYYKLKLQNKNRNTSQMSHRTLFEHYEGSRLGFINEALKRRDEEFLKAFFVMTNLDIVTGKRLPPNSGSKLKPAGLTNIGFKDVFKKLH